MESNKRIPYTSKNSSACVVLEMPDLDGMDRIIDNDLRQFDTETTVGSLEAIGIQVLSVDRNALVPGTHTRLDTRDRGCPGRWGFKPVLPIRNTGPGRWRSLGAPPAGEAEHKRQLVKGSATGRFLFTAMSRMG